MTLSKAKAIVLARHPAAKIVEDVHSGTTWYSVWNGKTCLSIGWLGERGAWNAAAESVQPGCTAPKDGVNDRCAAGILARRRKRAESKR